jgi:hypothetical protein
MPVVAAFDGRGDEIGLVRADHAYRKFFQMERQAAGRRESLPVRASARRLQYGSCGGIGGRREADPSISDAMNHAGELIEWAEREHRDWFWRCCRDHHRL